MMARDQGDVGCVTFQRLLEPEMVAFMLRGDHDEGFWPDGSLGEIEVFGDESLSLRKGATFGGGIVDGDAETHQISQRSERLSDPAVTHDEKFGLGQNRLD